ncbi:MAG: hypothetical protein BGO28_04345 [Alphaproteobacteria bacterium 43-37]|nr:MAG: hypothetical protein BGO28_04345 [Alphaproteobacteria bacterium 43-37]
MNGDDNKNHLAFEESLTDLDDSKGKLLSSRPKAKDYEKLSKALRHNLLKRKSQQRSRENSSGE